MNITTATAQFNKAREIKRSGNDFEAARAFLAAQRFAMRCRSAKRQDIIEWAHVGSTICAHRVLENSSSQSERSECGRIISESGYLFRNQ